jgi:pimeloyl-ACP methyl ester carboxylesterase
VVLGGFSMGTGEVTRYLARYGSARVAKAVLIDIPTLVIHGTADRILPYEATAKRLRGLIKDLRLVPVEGGPHNIGWTHPEEVNTALLDFLAA